LIMTWDQIRALARAGMDVESHGRRHRVLQTLDAEALQDDLIGSRQELEAQLGRPVRALAYPVGRRIKGERHIRAALAAAGYQIGMSNQTGVNRWWPPALRALAPIDPFRRPPARHRSGDVGCDVPDPGRRAAARLRLQRRPLTPTKNWRRAAAGWDNLSMRELRRVSPRIQIEALCWEIVDARSTAGAASRSICRRSACGSSARTPEARPAARSRSSSRSPGSTS